ncbi:RNA helicase [Salinivibrio sp. PR5]|uniref:DEAD/DEAH box helicase n=1 Tax=unclassified Salinivibrio TaxID=2636825 RepID=UPI000988F83C|nr:MULTISPECIES: DEAD/DEAH box helicase [unclassified Salinivibrio]OOF09647.1 RNA helicase [Salinivibrio sp. PR5]OOF17820.1 RNA helicase [Salinivibrio sp. PR932]
MQFDDLGLDRRLLSLIAHRGFEKPTDIQRQAIPVVMAGKDLLASSKTGSGKTLAFLLPAMQRVLRTKPLSRRDPRVLVLAPTRELAKQVYGQLRMLTSGTPHKAALVLGGENFNEQAKVFRQSPTFVVATPGRLADHLKQHHLSLAGLEMLILDEADRMLDLGFKAQLDAINEQANHRLRQTLMFSATLDHQQVTDMAAGLLKSPKRIAAGETHTLHSDIEQHFVLSDHLDHKHALLDHLMEANAHKQVMVFTATRADTERLAERFNQAGYKAIALSGELNQSSRNRIMDEFERGLHDVLVTTDVASRGLDLLNVSMVINFDLPKHAEEYIHRVGRTGRAGHQGLAYSLVGPKDWRSFKNIEAFLRLSLSFTAIEGLTGKFKGFKEKKSAKPQSKGPAKRKKPTQKAKPKAPKKRDKSFYNNVPAGDTPMMRKKPKPE